MKYVITLCVLLVGMFTASCAQNVGPTKWEYKLDTTVFDRECATQALASQQGEESIRSIIELFGYSHYALGQIWQSETCYGSGLPDGVLDKIMSDYIACGQQAFDAYAGGMGEAGWEMVSYSRIQHTTPGSQYCSAVVTDYGYEIMWKRPKTPDN